MSIDGGSEAPRPTVPSSAGRWRLPAVVLAIASTLFVGVTMRTGLVEADGLSLSAYGFPLPWLWRDLASSMSTLCDPLALALDIIVCLAGVALPAIALRQRAHALLVTRLWVCGLAVTVGAASVGLLGLDVALSAHLGHLDAGWRVVGREIVFGWRWPP